MSTPCDILCEEKDNAIYCLLRERSLEKAKCLALVHYYLMVESHMIENPDKIIVDITRQGLEA